MRIPRLALPAVVSLLLASEAYAAEASPAVDACAGKAKGDACSFEAPHKEVGGSLQNRSEVGTCQDDKCCELDYSKGSPPTSNCAPCLACKSDGSAAPPEAGGQTASAGPNQEAPRAGDEPPASSGNGKRGCSLGTDASAWALLLLLPLFAARSIRRR